VILKGRVWKFGNDVNTDVIIAGKYKYDTLNLREIAKHAFEAERPEFSSSVKEGDIIVAGRNFGCGSSREHAPLVLKVLGISAILAESFARIFYRNSINVGLPALECKGISSVREGDTLRINLETGTVKSLSEGTLFSFKPLPKAILEILREGGLVPYVKRRGGITFE